jgi:hypothetical protein
METFTEPREMVEDLHFTQKRAKALKQLRMSHIDPPIRDIVEGFQAVPHCFTIQSCHGHIMERGPDGGLGRIEPELGLPNQGLYQIAYFALVLENSEAGRKWYQALADLSLLDHEYIQFGSADWFWNSLGFLNSYVIQVEPHRFRHLDRFSMDRQEAQKWLSAKGLLFSELRKLLGLI